MLCKPTERTNKLYGDASKILPTLMERTYWKLEGVEGERAEAVPEYYFSTLLTHSQRQSFERKEVTFEFKKCFIERNQVHCTRSTPFPLLSSWSQGPVPAQPGHDGVPARAAGQPGRHQGRGKVHRNSIECLAFSCNKRPSDIKLSEIFNRVRLEVGSQKGIVG